MITMLPTAHCPLLFPFGDVFDEGIEFSLKQYDPVR